MIAVTGGGSGAISALLQVPGASRTMLEAVVPYADAALEQWLGGQPMQACSAPTARAMAMAAFARARRLAPLVDPQRLVGIGCTASLATNRTRRGDHRIHVGVQTARETASHSLHLEKGRRDRAAEELLATELVLWAVGDACGVDAGTVRETLVAHTAGEAAGEPLVSERERAPAALSELILGTRRSAVVKRGSTNNIFDEAGTPPLPVVFPGAFNPPHVGHLRMAAEAERRLGQPVAWELSVANVDKPPLDFLAMRERVEALRREDSARLIAITSAPTFREKARLFPDATFVVGADTIARIADLRYYGGDAAGRDDALGQIADRGCHFLVFGRQVGDQFQTVANLDLPASLRDLCDEVPAAEFREDVSSTELRGADGV